MDHNGTISVMWFSVLKEFTFSSKFNTTCKVTLKSIHVFVHIRIENDQVGVQETKSWSRLFQQTLKGLYLKSVRFARLLMMNTIAMH